MNLTAHNNVDKKIEELNWELYSARWTILNVAIARTNCWDLYEFTRCSSSKEARDWKKNIRENLIDLAKPIMLKNFKDELMTFSRAFCPLCGNGNDNDRIGGYSLPEGLSRHLEGYGNTHQCSVMEQILKLANKEWKKEFLNKEREEDLKRWANENAVKEQRLKSETLILIAPGFRPELFDDLYELGSNENQKEHLERLVWTENRLEDLGFSIQVLNNVKSFTKEYDEFVIFADPRRKGLIGFDVYKKPLPKKIINGKHASTKFIGEFDIRDAWKHDLISKFEKRVKNLHI